jgi:predicted nucleotidyltransferase
VVFAYLFGSQAKGTAGSLSDIDIAVYFDDEVDTTEYFDLKLEVLGEITDLYKTDEVDLVVLNEAPPLLAHRILKDGLLIFSDNEKVRLAFEVKAVLKYLDWKPYVDKYTKEVFGSEAIHGG